MAKRKTVTDHHGEDYDDTPDGAADRAAEQEHRAQVQVEALLARGERLAEKHGSSPYSSQTYHYGKKIDEETRITDARTGGAKGKKLAQLGAVDPAALLELAKVAGMGSAKYSRMNFMRGYAWSLSFDAMYRHVLAFANGEQNDPESGLNHMAHAAWHALALISFSERQLGTDDRYHEKAS